jgi:hypothetical protein
LNFYLTLTAGDTGACERIASIGITAADGIGRIDDEPGAGGGLRALRSDQETHEEKCRGHGRSREKAASGPSLDQIQEGL